MAVSSPVWSGDRPSDSDLVYAVRAGSEAKVRQMISDGANPNARDEQGEPVLIAALHAEKFDVARTLAAAPGIDLDAENGHAQTALMVAAYLGRTDLVSQLLGAGAEIHHGGWTALHFAASSGQVKVEQLLLENGAYIDAESPNRTTPLMMAARVKDRAGCQFLIDEGADPTARNDAGMGAGDFAAKAEDTELAAWFGRQEAAWRIRHETRPTAPD
jgi:ankyrin repeat protein